MAHHKHTAQSPHPKNLLRTKTFVLNTDCPRCGASLGDVDVVPVDLMHCPRCNGALAVAEHIAAGYTDPRMDRGEDIVSIYWLQPTRWREVAGPACDCAGCNARRAREA